MPYVVETSLKDPNYPSECPFCEKRNAETLFQRKFSRAKWVIPAPSTVFAGYRDYTIHYPSCNRCVSFFKYSKWISYLLIFIPWAFFFYIIFHSSDSDHRIADMSLIIALFCSTVALLILCYRFYRILGFRIGYIGDNAILYYSRSRSFSVKFANLNKSVSVFQMLAFKIK